MAWYFARCLRHKRGIKRDMLRVECELELFDVDLIVNNLNSELNFICNFLERFCLFI